MIDWTASMRQNYLFYKVDPDTWLDGEQIKTVKSCTLDNDAEAITLGSGSFTLGEELEECYVRVYLEVTQKGKTEKVALGTRLLMTPRKKYNGKSWTIDMDAYTPLIELKEKLPPLGYTAMEHDNVIDLTNNLIRENLRAPLIRITDQNAIIQSDYTANTNDTWLTYLTDLLSLVKYQLSLDESGRVMYAPVQTFEALQPRETFTDDNSSILYADVSEEDDMYGVPNVVEVVYSNSTDYYTVRVVNDDPNSPVSTVRRGREIQYRETSPNIMGNPTIQQVEEYAENLLKNLSTITKTITFQHGYKPVRVGDAVMLNYRKAGLYNVKAVIVRQSIECGKSCSIQETVTYTKRLWK